MTPFLPVGTKPARSSPYEVLGENDGGRTRAIAREGESAEDVEGEEAEEDADAEPESRADGLSNETRTVSASSPPGGGDCDLERGNDNRPTEERNDMTFCKEI